MPDCPAKPKAVVLRQSVLLFCDNFQEVSESTQKISLAFTKIEVSELRFLDVNQWKRCLAVLI